MLIDGMTKSHYRWVAGRTKMASFILPPKTRFILTATEGGRVATLLEWHQDNVGQHQWWPSPPDIHCSSG